MKRKLIFFSIILILVVAGVCVLHFKSIPDEAPIIPKDNSIPASLSYDEVNEYVYEQGKDVCLFFFSSTETDSLYVIEKVIGPIMETKGLTEITNLIYVDLTNLDTDKLGEKYTKNNWGFYNYPTFLVMKIDNSSGLVVSDKLEWDSSAPYTSEDVAEWLKSHKLIK